MKIAHKFLAFCTCAALLAGAGSTAQAFTDVQKGSGLADAVAVLEKNGIAVGTGNSIFEPDAALTTSGLVTFLGRIAGETVNQTAVADGIRADGWSGGYMTWALENGLIDSGNSQYQELTAAEANQILSSFCSMQKKDQVRVSSAGDVVTRGEAAIALAGLLAQNTARPSNGNDEVLQLSNVKYTTITTGEDWGPAISKVILNFGVEIDPASVTADKFAVSSVRSVPGYDSETGKATEAVPKTGERSVTAAYICDEHGAKSAQGTYIALELQIGPQISAGSPFNFDMVSMHNQYVDTYYEISLKTPLSTVEGKSLTMETTGASGAAGNVTLIADDFTKGSHIWKGDEQNITLTYAAWVPHEGAAAGSTPLIIWLHGVGEGGDDPTVAVIGNKVVNLATDTVQRHFGNTGAEILVPQTPTFWLDNGTGGYRTTEEGGRSYYTDALMSLIKTYVAEHPEIDTKRIYIGGCSNGGYMVVNMIVEFPDYFAAAYPVCQAYKAAWLTDEAIESIKDIPIWLTAAKTDRTVVIYEGETDAETSRYILKLDKDGNPIPINDYSNFMYEKLTAAGAKDVHYSLFDKVEDTSGLYFQTDGTTPYEYAGHWSWLYTLNDECVEMIDGEKTTIFQWLSTQSK